MRKPTLEEIQKEIQRREEKEHADIQAFLHRQTQAGLEKLLIEAQGEVSK